MKTKTKSNLEVLLKADSINITFKKILNNKNYSIIPKEISSDSFEELIMFMRYKDGSCFKKKTSNGNIKEAFSYYLYKDGDNLFYYIQSSEPISED